MINPITKQEAIAERKKLYEEMIDSERKDYKNIMRMIELNKVIENE